MKRSIFILFFLIIAFILNLILSIFNSEYNSFIKENKRTLFKTIFKENSNTWTLVKVDELIIPKVVEDRLSKDFKFVKTEDKIFWFDFDDTKYSAYFDPKNNTKIFVVNKWYDEFFSILWKKASWKFSIKEVPLMFFWRTLYLNSLVTDYEWHIRFVFFVWWKTIWIETPKEKYDLIKQNLK